MCVIPGQCVGVLSVIHAEGRHSCNFSASFPFPALALWKRTAGRREGMTIWPLAS